MKFFIFALLSSVSISILCVYLLSRRGYDKVVEQYVERYKTYRQMKQSKFHKFIPILLIIQWGTTALGVTQKTDLNVFNIIATVLGFILLAALVMEIHNFRKHLRQ